LINQSSCTGVPGIKSRMKNCFFHATIKLSDQTSTAKVNQLFSHCLWHWESHFTSITKSVGRDFNLWSLVPECLSQDK
jgi:hypothetical protein